MAETETQTETPAERGRRFAADGLEAGALHESIDGTHWISLRFPVDGKTEGREILTALRKATGRA